MTELENAPQPEGADVYVITYDEDCNEERVLPADIPDGGADQSRDFGINKGQWRIERIKHGPLISAEIQLRTANVGSLGRAIVGNYHGTTLIVDRSAPPIEEDIYDIDRRYDIDMRDGVVVAVVTQRYPTQPAQPPEEIAVGLARIAAAYDCRIADVSFALPGGGTPEEMLSHWPEGEDWAEQLRVDTIANLAMSAHDVKVFVTTNEANAMATLMDGAAAIADFLDATQGGSLDAVAILNLLRGDHLNVLIGESESAYLEVKTAMHPIWVERPSGLKAKIELAQDVARFANGDVDAILVIGYREATGGGHQIGRLTPVSDTYLNIAQIEKVLDERIIPPVDGLVVEKVPASSGQSVLAIYVPKQPAEMQPYLVHGAIAEGKVEGDFIVRRRGEGSITTSAQQIHAYIVAGKRYLRGKEVTTFDARPNDAA